ncbi:hypothetical protein [Microbacterium sp. A93]|uniref:hypothetical protein n=1 Tax=unclassified Microbacterium TaxID=2609290 RepID=UPI003F44023B
MTTSDQQGNLPLTRKQLREIRLTGTTPVITEDEAAAAQAASAAALPSPPEPAHVAPVPQVEAEAEVVLDSGDAPLTRRRVRQQEQIRTASVSVIVPEEPEVEDAAEADDAEAEDTVDEISVDEVSDEEISDAEVPAAEVLDDEPVITGERPVVSPKFGQDLLSEQSDVPAFTPSFDELITSGSGGSQNLAPNTLIFTPTAGEGSLSGPVASTGEVLVTGSYELPQGIGSQGHAHGTADGKEADAVLIDGELPPASSPTPIAASAAVSTIKPAGEVIRPPAPDKGNKLMLILAITAGGLALVLAAALVIAFTMNVF